MTLNRSKGRMFKSVKWTWNPIVGCTHGCRYCYARRIYTGDFDTPRFRRLVLTDDFPGDGSWIFVGSMCDMWCKGVPTGWILDVLNKIKRDGQDNVFLLQTKSPARFVDLSAALHTMDNIILGTTLETNRDTSAYSDAPAPWDRYRFMGMMKDVGYKTFVSLEPIADFDVDVLSSWVLDLEPEAVEVGVENYTAHTPPPSPEDVEGLISLLEAGGINVERKRGLDDWLTK